jgi:hypothetical protein
MPNLKFSHINAFLILQPLHERFQLMAVRSFRAGKL